MLKIINSGAGCVCEPSCYGVILFGILCYLILFPVCAHLDSGLAPLPALRLEGSGMADSQGLETRDKKTGNPALLLHFKGTF